ncbi:hypothetical protein MACH24_09650 [Erythrobacter sp. Dej080120_24]|uniref:DUF4132 domain-containing protein n=1 Tax=Erythrobacter sp. Dej080120_24 TaxID=3024837 RepID=UPI00291F94FF|nr:hypothetical protein MACH24_09650 [Erythrobacter sp. Dej080120_24]
MALNSFLYRLGQALGDNAVSSSAVKRTFAKQLGSQLAGRIESYVQDGGASSVLSDCSHRDNQNKWRQRHYVWRREGEGIFSDLSRWNIDQMARFGEVLAALEPITHEYGRYGSKKSPDWLRHIVQWWLSAQDRPQPVETLVDLCDLRGLGAEGPLEILFSRDPTNYRSDNCLDRFTGVESWLRENAPAIANDAVQAGADARAQLATAIGRFRIHDLYLAFLLDLAMGTAKGARAAAIQSLTGAKPETLEAAFEATYAEANPTRRAHLIEAAANTLGDRAGPLIERLRESESSAKVKAAMDRVAGAVTSSAAKPRNPWQKDGASGFVAIDGEWVPAPERTPPPERSKIDREAYDLLRAPIEAYNTHLKEMKQRYKDVPYHWSKHQVFAPVDDAIAKLRAIAEGQKPVSQNYNYYSFVWLHGQHAKSGEVDQFFDHPSVTLRHVVRLARGISGNRLLAQFADYASAPGLALQRRLAKGADMRSLVELWREAGGEDFVEEYLGYRWYYQDHGLPGEAWPMLLDEMNRLDEAMGIIPQTSNTKFDTLRTLRLLTLFPKVPERYRNRLMILANESGVKIREQARDLLADAEGIEDAIALQLDDGKQDVRAQAADWLAQRGAATHIPAIRARLKKERSDKARAQMISALERLGDDTSDFFDEKAMVQEAEKGLKKAMPKGLDWFPFDGLPALNWSDGRPVNPILPRYWVVLATRLKETGGNALIDLWLDRLAPGDAHKLGWMILTGWIAQDTRTPSDEEANQHALSRVDQQLAWNKDTLKRWPQSADWISTDYNTVFAQIKRGFASNYLGSAADSKGMLALASRVEGSDAGPRIRAFLKNHGSRTSQAKALLDVLANIGTPAALQVLLQTADRLKQKSVQAHAAKLIEDVAERRGWSAGELADRTVPTGGLDEDGTLQLECGADRIYTARLDEEDKLALFNPLGKEVKALPPARMDEEKSAVADAKKVLSKARKEVKQVVTAQTERFREAMCMERTWSSEDWINYVASHPIVGRLAARLVWIGTDKDGNPLASFRPLGDGSCTDQVDEDIDPADFSQIKLAHSTLLDADTRSAWATHIVDYDVKPLFDQLGRLLPEISEATRKQRLINDREGWMIETFKLRGIATKLGYQRGPAEDGGWFMTYHRVLREAKLVAEVEFTGSTLPEQNMPAALISLSFRNLREDGKFGTQVAFENVPDVLLAETWRDYHDMADKGSGFDPDWQKKAGL